MKYWYCLLIIFMVSCNRNKQDTSRMNVVDIDPRTTTVINVSDFVKDTQFIELEFTDQSILKRISSVFYHDGKYIIADKGTKAIYIFSQEGKFLSKINRRGRATNEYLNMSRVMFDADNEWIIICDMTALRLLYYTLSGECVKSYNLAEKMEHRFQDIINLPNGNFLCYEFMHGTPTPSGFDGIWEITPEGEEVRWFYRSNLIHPTSSPVYAMSFNPQGNISIMCMEEDADFEYDGELSYRVKYIIQGKTASSYGGMNNSDYAIKWAKGEMFNSRQWATKMGGYILSKWSGDKKESIYYSLYDSLDNTITVGNRIEYCKEGKPLCFPSVVLNNKDESLEIIPSNFQGCIAIPLYMETLLSDRYSSYASLLIGNKDPEKMNPILQICTVR